MTDLRAITVRHPWALAIALGVKPVENRNGASITGQARKVLGQRVAIHASAQMPGVPVAQILGRTLTHNLFEAFEKQIGGDIDPDASESRPMLAMRRTAGHILAVGTLARVIETGDGDPLHASPWRVPTDRFALVLTNVERLPEPVPARGALGIWRVPEDVAARVRAQIAEAA